MLVQVATRRLAAPAIARFGRSGLAARRAHDRRWVGAVRAALREMPSRAATSASQRVSARLAAGRAPPSSQDPHRQGFRLLLAMQRGCHLVAERPEVSARGVRRIAGEQGLHYPLFKIQLALLEVG
jgi:hypothetical protein